MTTRRSPANSTKRSRKAQAKRVRKNLIVDPDALARAMAAIHSTNMSQTVNVALDRLAEDAAILAGIDAATGAMPDFPFLDS